MLKVKQSSISKKGKAKPFSKKEVRKDVSHKVFKQKDIVFFLRFVARHGLRSKAYSMLEEKIHQSHLH